MTQVSPRRRRLHRAEPPAPPEIQAAVEQALAAVAPVRKDKALPLLQAIQARLGHLPEPALAYASRRSRIPLADLNALVSFYDLLTSEPHAGTVTHYCDDIVCRCRPGYDQFIQALQQSGHTVHGAPCLGRCEQGPVALQTRTAAEPALAFGGFGAWQITATQPARFAWPDDSQPMLLSRCGRYTPTDLNSYRQAGGLTALDQARSMTRADVVAQVKASKLVGRGGAAFPTGIKWEGVLVAPTPLGPGPDGAAKYVVVNADESEPGTFTNRVLMEEDPMGVIECALIAAHAVGADQIYVYIRGEYPLAVERCSAALAAFREAGLLGGVGFEIRCGGGRYICGEETALFASIEGERGAPRVKPPFPTTNGLFDRPTLINNVETLHNLIPLLTLGVDAWNAREPKLFSIAGDVTRPGVYEVPMGTTLRALIDLAGGPVGEVQAVLMGGASGMFIGPEKLDTPLEFKAMAAAGATVGSGAVMVYNAETDLWDVARRAARFFAEESCGKCVPCRVGTARQEELVDRFAEGQTQWIPLHRDIGQAMADASICGLGHTAMNPVRSLLKLKGVQ
ncbi:MAG: NADH-ubiquinone oxidoreductase-F iron-sulfur binding region domain-containing protein [Bacillota bacterium]